MQKPNSNLRIIIIDDNADIHQDFIKILKSKKGDISLDPALRNVEKTLFGDDQKDNPIELTSFDIDTASQGEEGVKKIAEAFKENRPYSLAFVDIRMPPGWDGIKTIKHIWKIDPNIQVVICTAFSDYSWEETVKELGERDNLLILKKPFDNISVRQLACALTKKWELIQETKTYTHSLEKKVHERTKELQYQATHDQLTNLPNRVLLLDQIRQNIQKYENTTQQFSVIFLDLDKFKLINDSLSHEAGDHVLRFVADRLKQFIRKGDMLARFGGDEFVILFNDVKSDDELVEFCQRILKSFHEPFHIADHEITLTASIGISVYPRDAKSIDSLLRNADISMYHSKNLGSNQYQFFTQELNELLVTRLQKESELRKAIDRNEFVLFYQPQIDLKTNALVSVEALIRWNHPKKGFVLPIDFIPLAEDSGLIIPIGEWVLKSACQQLKKWHMAGMPKIRMAVNITTKQFRQYNLVKVIENILKEVGLEAKYLELELTENIIINNQDIIDIIYDLKALGIQIALDDFGTGYSSLNYLRVIPVDRLKIDQSFVKNIDSSRGDNVIINAIITMAKSLNLEVLAEGVETQRQLEFLKKQKCGEVQGFYFSKPISEAECEDILKHPEHLHLFEDSHR